MLITISDRNEVVTQQLRELADRRLRFALSRFDAKIQRISLVVTDANGPRGGMDKSCRITVKLRRAPEVTVADVDADLATCICRAAERVGRAVGRSVQRRQQFDRTQPLSSDSGATP